MASLLGAPLALPCGATLPNRIAKSAMNEGLADPRTLDPTPGLERLYRTWAEGGAGLLVTGNVMVDRQALGEPRQVVFDAATDMAAARAWARAATAAGNPAWVQLNHPGRQTPRGVGGPAVAPSAVPMKMGFGLFATPRALEAKEIAAIVEAFGAAAAQAKAAGFTGVQLHGAHGYLVSQFLSPRTNQREDEWGGTPEKRRRFPIAVVAAMRAAVGPGFPVGVKLNSADFQRGGFDEAESMAVVEALEAAGVDLLEISGGTYEAPVMMGERPKGEVKASTAAREAYFLGYAEAVRARTKLPLMLTGGFRTRAGMEDALASGAVDVIGLARPMAVEPDLPARLLDGRAEGALPMALPKLGYYDSFVELAWHEQQLARMAAGQAPDPGRTPWLALGIGLVEHGWSVLFPRRGG